jgi:hypothetical protein
MKSFVQITLLILIFITPATSQQSVNTMKNPDRIQAWSENPRYWQFKGRPVLLLGGSKTDHLFLAENLLDHLNEMQEVGANYVRNTMSQRESSELKPHKLIANGKFDLNLWNEDYWTRFENMLSWTYERGIVVQIEVWDRFDFSIENWEDSPWNPKNNVNYSYEQSGFSRQYPKHPSQDKQPFFHSIPGMPMYNPLLDKIRDHQENFVSKILSYSLKYGHVLYCMDNETSTPPEWGKYWIKYIKSNARDRDILVYTTDMFDDAWKGTKGRNTKNIFEDPGHYMFADISQVNSRNFDDDHWNQVLWLIDQVDQVVIRPCNHTKIYGGGYSSFGSGGLEDGVERFWRNIIGGSASARFHRPGSGNGLNERAKACISAARLTEGVIKFWDIEPHMELLSDCLPNEAYLAAKPGEQYLLYFTYGGSVGLDLADIKGSFRIKWVSITEGRWLDKEEVIEGGTVAKVTAPHKGGWVAVITTIK